MIFFLHNFSRSRFTYNKKIDPKYVFLLPSFFFRRNAVRHLWDSCHCVKSGRIRSFSGPYLTAFGLNTERYCVSLRIQSKSGNAGQKHSEYGQFSRIVYYLKSAVVKGIGRLLENQSFFFSALIFFSNTFE